MGEQEADDPVVVRIYAPRGDASSPVSAFGADLALSDQVREAMVAASEQQFTQASISTWKTELEVVVRDEVDQGTLSRLLDDEVGRMDHAASRFREDSELSAVNAGAGGWVPVSDYFAQVLCAALEAAELTDGLVSPCLGQLVDAAGYRAWRDADVPPAATGADPVHRDDWQEVQIRRHNGQMQVRIPPGVQLDVGAVAKGWLADRLSAKAVEAFGCDALANMGGDLRARTDDDPWIVTVNPMVPGVPAQSLRVWDAGLATSGTGRRRWRTADGGSAHHIIDPRSGLPAVTPWMTCSVLAASAAQANTASTAGLVLGEDGPAWLVQTGLDAWFVAADEEQVRIGRWPDPRG